MYIPYPANTLDTLQVGRFRRILLQLRRQVQLGGILEACRSTSWWLVRVVEDLVNQGAGCWEVIRIHAQLLQQAMVFWLSIQQFQQIGRLHPLKLYLPVHIDLLVERDIHKAGAVAALFAGIQACTEGSDILVHLEADDRAVVINDICLSVPGTGNHLLMPVARDIQFL